ncbi:MAG: dynamin family protein [Selenomonadaceae bacterium]|nr:dynamin family protein [Selenomonadaceae bacterium]
MADWEENKQEFIEKLESASRAFDEIFKVDSDELVIQGEERDKLKKLAEENKVMLQKLKKNEFSVSIVGLEKAGKSTLGNALIKSMVLPEDAQRCTYTTTEIRAGEKDIAEVRFYTREEFNKNFKRMLKELEYPGDADFDTMSERAFKDYWHGVEADPSKSTLVHAFAGNTVKDIEEMLAGKSTIMSLLGQPPKLFTSESWEGKDINEFKTYVTGMAGKNPDGSAIRKPHPYAVKNIIIKSAQLGSMSHMVLYDVPGFDSPTELHKKQTEAMLKESDAIILVTNVGDRPNLTGPQLDMLRKGHDAYGVKLSDKVFIFGNKIDRAPDAATGKSNLAALKNDSINNHIARSERIIVGSARSYLEKLGKIEGNVASKIIDEWQLENGDGVDFLHDMMQEYYDNDRFAVLSKRAEVTLSDTRDMLTSLLDRYNSGELSFADAGAEVYMDIRDHLPEFIQEANIITNAYATEIGKTRPFSVQLKKEVNAIYPLVTEAHEDLITNIENSLSISPGMAYQTSTVNGIVRNKLQNQFVEEIVKQATKLTGEKQAELREALVDSFLKIMGMDPHTIYRDELIKSVNDLFDKMLIDGGKECNFNSLVERFAKTAIETIILWPFGSPQRLQKTKELLPELVSLSVYYNLPADNEEEKELNLTDIGRGSDIFFAKILAHEGIDTDVDSEEIKENENFLTQLFDNNKEQIVKGISVAADFLPTGKWAKLLIKAGVNIAQMAKDKNIKHRDQFESKFEDLIYSDKWEKLSAEERAKAVDNLVQNHSANTNKGDNNGLSDILQDLSKKGEAISQMPGKEDMIAILDADIEILRDVTEKSVINAIGLERAFISVVVKNVELIREHLQKGDGAKDFNAWIRAHAKELMPSKFTQIIEDRAVSEKRRGIVNAVKNVLDTWKV